MSVRRLLPVLLALLLALAAIGARPLWDPDEGRYSNVALNMLESGDWVHPMRSEEVGHWTKPPLTYWAIASSVGLFGYEPWAARLPGALAFLASIWLTFRIARRLTPGREALAATIYATMAMPLIAAHWVSTDFLLSAMVALALLGFVEARWGAGPRWRWLALMWLGFALAFLTKGPPGLLYLPVILAVQWLAPARELPVRRMLWLPGLALFAVVGLGWYARVALENPELAGYFLGREVVARTVGDGFGRNAEWYGWFKVYFPVLLLGTLPWTARLWRAIRGLPGEARRWLRSAEARRAEPQRLLLWTWVLLPLLVFCLAKSRMPLYLLPLFPALAMLAGTAGPPLRLFEDRRTLWLGAWVALMIGLRVAWAGWPTDKDAARWAEAIRERADGPVSEVIFVDHGPHYGLHLHLRAMVEVVSVEHRDESPLASRYDHDLAHELAEPGTGRVFVTRARHWDALVARARELGYEARPLGAPFEGRIIAVLEPAPAAQP